MVLILNLPVLSCNWLSFVKKVIKYDWICIYFMGFRCWHYFLIPLSNGKSRSYRLFVLRTR